MATYKEFSNAAKKQGMSQSQIDAARWKMKNNASVWTGAVAWMAAQPKTTTLPSNKNMSEWGMSFASDYTKSILAGWNGYNSPASDYSKSLLNWNTWNGYSSPASDYSKSLLNWTANTGTKTTSTKKTSTSTSSWLSTKKTAATNENAVYDANGNYLWSRDIVGSWTQTTQTTSEYQKRLDLLNSMKWKISDEQYNQTLQQIQEKFGWWTTTPTTSQEQIVSTEADFDETQAGYFRDAEWNEIKIYGYQALSPDMKKYVDQMSDAEKKKISNMWAQALQNYIKQYADSKYQQDYIEKQYGLAKDMRRIQEQQEDIQFGQQLRQAEEQVNNLMQNREYLWNMWMPWLSKTKLQAISDSIKEANTSLDEMRRLQDLSKQASAKWRDIDVAQYEKQISDIVRDLNYKIPQEIQNALNKYTVAELEGNLDTIDWIVAFKKSLLDDLDNNISWMTSASLEQMNYITQNYMNLADQAYQEAKEYQQNANVVNSEMSAVRGYYVDWNGNAILDSQWLPIQVSQWAPMDPIFDKESGKLIQFGYDENWNITASVTQVYDGDQSNMQATIVSLLEQWVSVQDILKYVPGADLKTVQELSKAVSVQYRTDWLSKTYNWKQYTATTQEKVNQVLQTLNKWWRGWQCGYFVNNYLEDLWVGRLYSDPITDKTKNINSMEAKVGNVVVMDSPTKPEYWHVWIITAIDPKTGDMTILQSNKNWNEQIYTTVKNVNDDWIYGFFDPTKSIEQYNAESTGMTAGGWQTFEYENGFDPIKVGYYDKFIKWKMVSSDRDKMGPNFEQETRNYQQYVNNQVPESARVLLAAIEEMKKMSRKDYTQAATWLPYTDGYKFRKKFDQFIASASLQNLIDLKSQWATFGALSDNELGFITNSATDIDFKMKYKDFMDNLEQYEQTLKSKLNKYNSTSGGMSTDEASGMIWGRGLF